MKTGVELIAAERERQVAEEGWDASHDDEHNGDEMAMAAVCYALPGYHRSDLMLLHRDTALARFWPWHDSDWKPSPDDRVRELVKAGALIAAEIDRIQRHAVGEDD